MIVPLGSIALGACIPAESNRPVIERHRASRSSSASTTMPSAMRPGTFTSTGIEAASSSNPPFSTMSNPGTGWWYWRRCLTTCKSSGPSTSRRRAVSELSDKGLPHFDALFSGYHEVGFGVFDGSDAVLVAFKADQDPVNIVVLAGCLGEARYAIPTVRGCQNLHVVSLRGPQAPCSRSLFGQSGVYRSLLRRSPRTRFCCWRVPVRRQRHGPLRRQDSSAVQGYLVLRL